MQTLHPDLHALLYLQTLKTTPGGGRAAPSHLMSSFEEVRATNLLKGEERSGRWRAHNERYLSRVYPAAARVDSSNFEPSPFWDSGVQMVALNWQTTHTLPMHLNTGLFQTNGGVGYVLKPPALLSPPRQGDLPPPTASEVAHLRTSAAVAGRRPSTMEARALVEEASKTEEDPWEDAPSRLPERLRDGTLPVTRVRVRLLWAELLPMPGQHRHIAHSADLAKDLHPPEAPSLGHLQGEVLQPYVTVEVHGGTFSGAASTLQSVVQGSRFKSGYADNGFAPTWEGQSCECAASHPELALLRFSVYHHSKFDATDELVAAEALPLRCARAGYRVVQLRDPSGSRLALAKLLVHVEVSDELLPPSGVRETCQAGELKREQRPVHRGARVSGGGGAAVGGEGGGVFGFKARGWWNGLRGGSVYVKESAGMVRVTVSRLQGDAPALLYFTTEDGSAQAGLDYEATSGHVFFRAREKEKTVKVIVIDDDVYNADKTFYIRLLYPEGGELNRWRDRVRVVILDDDRNWAEIVRRTYVYSALSVASMFFALIGNDLCLLLLAAEHDVAVGWATLAVFVFFIFDIVINVKLLKWGYALSVRFVLDLIATLVMLFFVPDFIDLMSSLFGQGFLQIVTQGSAARASRARAPARAPRAPSSRSR